MAADRLISPSHRGWPHLLGCPVSLRHALIPEPERRHPDDFHFSCSRLVCGGIVHHGWRVTHEIQQQS